MAEALDGKNKRYVRKRSGKRKKTVSGGSDYDMGGQDGQVMVAIAEDVDNDNENVKTAEDNAN